MRACTRLRGIAAPRLTSINLVLSFVPKGVLGRCGDKRTEGRMHDECHSDYFAAARNHPMMKQGFRRDLGARFLSEPTTNNWITGSKIPILESWKTVNMHGGDPGANAPPDLTKCFPIFRLHFKQEGRSESALSAKFDWLTLEDETPLQLDQPRRSIAAEECSEN